MTDASSSALNMLALSRRAGKLVIGSDKIFSALGKGSKLAVFIANDVSENALRKLNAASARDELDIYRLTVGRNELGRRVGVTSAQAAAIRAEDGFAAKIISLLPNSEKE